MTAHLALVASKSIAGLCFPELGVLQEILEIKMTDATEIESENETETRQKDRLNIREARTAIRAFREASMNQIAKKANFQMRLLPTTAKKPRNGEREDEPGAVLLQRVTTVKKKQTTLRTETKQGVANDLVRALAPEVGLFRECRVVVATAQMAAVTVAMTGKFESAGAKQATSLTAHHRMPFSTHLVVGTNAMTGTFNSRLRVEIYTPEIFGPAMSGIGAEATETCEALEMVKVVTLAGRTGTK
mmetsp:Transcript_48657/g.95385  ORF Transcript_48657/g.95385 Transcript_48657/m.95385 type:complete len:245 (+) Transcript_48657:422-1156(+)